ncbi:hypothetical protein BBP00_00003910 [Phytophthora kernoviae]|uniref:EF-hand domain-containing protein n=1 Tax=Phytophthora kernoviae TaxID=325452 RepID=A0A3F2RUP9_9STRA|nr:hypothetical protein BBP00_00003910 [Phytophthora kernoviae]
MMRHDIVSTKISVWVLLSVIVSLEALWVNASGLADDWYASTRCNEGSSSTACRNYERCKATHRCARGDEDYKIKSATLTSYTRQFGGGERVQTPLMNDFEDWKSGTHRWRFKQPGNDSSNGDSMLEPKGWLGWDTFDFPVIGSLELAAGHLVFDTDRAELRGDVQFNGIVTTTRLGGTSVAVFNFMTMYLGAGVKVRLQGHRAIALLSRSSSIVDTELRVRPGTLGGFPGGGFIGTGTSVPGVNNNQNGPGSSSVRVYVKTLSTWGKHVPEVQEIETSAASGQKLQGHFILRYSSIDSAGLSTMSIPYDASALDVRRRLETAFPDIGELNVQRDDMSEQVPEIGRLWRVTFLSAVGNVPQLQAQSFLSGLDAKVVTRTIVDGNQLSGTFRLSFLSATTRWLAHNVTADLLRSAMLEDLPGLINARVSRTDAGGKCLQGSTLPDQTASSSIDPLDVDIDQGLYRPSEWFVPEHDLVEVSDSTKGYPAKRCRAGRGAANGFVWKLQFWTRNGNIASMSPTSITMTDVAAPATLDVDYSRLQGLEAVATVVDSQCFSLAFGGAGASFAGPGGSGYSVDLPNDIAQDNDELMLAIALVDGNFVHEANTFQWPRQVFQDKVQTDRWYKLDVTLDWQTNKYSIRLNDVLKVSAITFQGAGVSALSLNNFHAMSTWWDEIYVGNDYLMGFACPWIRQVADAAAVDADSENEGAVLTTKRMWRELWADSFMEPTTTTYHPMVRHESHLSQQEIYAHDNGGIVPLDGAPHRAFLDDIREKESEISDSNSYEEQQAAILAGNGDEEVITNAELLTIEGLPLDRSIVEPLETGIDWEAMAGSTSASTPSPDSDAPPHPSIYWYSEVFNMNTGNGGIGACSTVDFNEWRNEGIMVDFSNLSDPFGDRQTATGGLFADRPKVIFNRVTKRFVMWMHVDNASLSSLNTLGLTGVASSEYPNGPFTFVHSLYPDAVPLEAPGGQSINETHDQTIAIIPSSSGHTVQDAAYLVRTYYKTVEYWLPRPVMDPLWQSVQKPSATTAGNTTTDFGLSYHRAFHHLGYDDPTDIYLQRWRMEDTPWEVICCSLTDTSSCVSVTKVPQRPEDVCPEGMKKKAILGQAQTQSANDKTPNIVETRYKDPNDDANSAFVPNTSVPAYTSWGFQVLNTKTWRGNYFDALSTNITLFIFKRYAGERRRLEIERDPTIQYTYPNEEELTGKTIPTSDTEILDELLSTLGVPVTTAFKSKYSSYDLAEIDRDGDGKITSNEVALLEEQKALKKLTSDFVDTLVADFNVMKWGQVAILDADGDGLITFEEFEGWLGLDPNLIFDRFDLDKNGFLDENELARSLWYRQMPRLDAAIFMLDPSFEGRVYYEKFHSLLLQAPDYVFRSYDFDSSGTLTQFEIDFMVKDLGSAFARPAVLSALKNSTTNIITQASYATWFSSTTSLVDGARNKLKVDNAVHATGTDRLIGPLHVVERRRAKYVAISALTDDYLSTRGMLREVEGDFEGREALINFFAFSEDLFGLVDSADGAELGDDIKPFREFLSPAMLNDRASYWNGRHWEGRPSAPAQFSYGSQCFQISGLTTSLDEETSGCLPCLTSSPYATSEVQQYQSVARGTAQCQPQEKMNAYIKAFDQQVSIQLQYQQQSQFGPQGLQPHMSPCYNQSQFFPCDVQKVVDGNVADTLHNWTTRETPQNLAWEKHPNNVGSSTKIRADNFQAASTGPSYIERFPLRVREPLNKTAVLDSITVYTPDELTDVLGGGR